MNPINFDIKKVLFIDLDDTLIKTISGKTFPEDITDFRIQLPVLDKIVKKLPRLKYFYIATNQGGMGKFIEKEDFITKIASIQEFCRCYLNNKCYPRFIYIGYEYCDSTDKADPRRKPNTGMLEWFCEYISIKDKSKYIMIGDASGKPGDFSDSDKKCAENFGIDYIDVEDFLKL